MRKALCSAPSPSLAPLLQRPLFPPLKLQLTLCAQVSEHGTVRVEKLMEVERYSHVMHISSTVGTLCMFCTLCAHCTLYTLCSRLVCCRWHAHAQLTLGSCTAHAKLMHISSTVSGRAWHGLATGVVHSLCNPYAMLHVLPT